MIGNGVNTGSSLIPDRVDNSSQPSQHPRPPPPLSSPSRNQPNPSLSSEQRELLSKAMEAELLCIEAEEQRLSAQKAAVQARTSALEAYATAYGAGLTQPIPDSIVSSSAFALTQSQPRIEHPRSGKGMHLQAADMEILDGEPTDFHSIPRQIIDDAASRHEIPLDALTRESLRAFNLHTKKIPESFNPKGEANIAPRIKWDFTSELSLSYADSLEALENYIHLLRNAGYPSAVVDMFIIYINDMRN
ncbi:hypothetical protein M407DRAFT_236663, partial [Tulasnella calospora MUT 4182]